MLSLAFLGAGAATACLGSGLKIAGNQINFEATSSLAWTSNANAAAGGGEDYITSTSVGATLWRRAGIFGLDADAGMTVSDYLSHQAQDSTCPHFGLTVTRARGRLTGSLAVRAFREAASDTLLNEWTDSWNFPVNLQLHYPVNSRCSIGAETGYSSKSFRGGADLSDYSDFSQGLSLAYHYSPRLDLLARYQFRSSRAEAHARAFDHSASLGLSGPLTGKLKGEITAGYQGRTTRSGGAVHSGLSAGMDLTWRGPWRTEVVARLARDYSTTARGASTAGTTASLTGRWPLVHRLSLHASASLDHDRLLKSIGGDEGRRDASFGLTTGLGWRLNSHLEIGLGATRNRVDSNRVGYSRTDYGWNLSATTRW